MACERPHEHVDLRVAQPGQEVAEPARHPQLRSQPLLPAPLVAAEEALIEPSLLEALDESVGGDGGRQQAVEDASPRRGLGESAGIADDEQALGVRLANVPDGYEPPDRRAGLRDQPLAEVGAGHQSVEAGAGVAACHDADLQAVATGPPDRHDPGEAIGRNAAADVEVDAVRGHGVDLELRRVEDATRQPEAEQTLEAIANAAREHAGPRPDPALARGDINAVSAQADAAHAGARRDHGAGLAGLRGQAAVERPAIDDEDLFAPASVPDDLGRGATRGQQVGPAHTLE